jgi:hypothetical protein
MAGYVCMERALKYGKLMVGGQTHIFAEGSTGLVCIGKRGGTTFYSLNIFHIAFISVCFGLFLLIFCLFRFNRNTETRCFGKEAKQPKQTFGFG